MRESRTLMFKLNQIIAFVHVVSYALLPQWLSSTICTCVLSQAVSSSDAWSTFGFGVFQVFFVLEANVRRKNIHAVSDITPYIMLTYPQSLLL